MSGTSLNEDDWSINPTSGVFGTCHEVQKFAPNLTICPIFQFRIDEVTMYARLCTKLAPSVPLARLQSQTAVVLLMRY